MLPTIPVKIITELHEVERGKGVYSNDDLLKRGIFDIVSADTNPAEINMVMSPDEMNFHRIAQVTSFSSMMPTVKSIIKRPDLQLTVYNTTFDSIHVAGMDSKKERKYFIIRYRAIIKDQTALLVKFRTDDLVLGSYFVARNEPFVSVKDIEQYLAAKTHEVGINTTDTVKACLEALELGLNKKEWVSATVGNMTVELYHQ